MPVTVKTTGDAKIHRPAERGVLRFSVKDTGPNKAAASGQVLSCTKIIREMLEGFSPKLPNGEAHPGAAITYWSMGSLSTTSYPVYDRNDVLKGREFSTTTDFEVKFRDFKTLSLVAADLSAMDLVMIDGVSWRLTDATKEELISQVRAMAAEDAMARARDYAGPFQLQTINVAEIDEGRSDDLYDEAGAPTNVRFGVARHTTADHALSFHPEDVTLSARVLVKFIAE